MQPKPKHCGHALAHHCRWRIGQMYFPTSLDRAARQSRLQAQCRGSRPYLRTLGEGPQDLRCFCCQCSCIWQARAQEPGTASGPSAAHSRGKKAGKNSRVSGSAGHGIKRYNRPDLVRGCRRKVIDDADHLSFEKSLFIVRSVESWSKAIVRGY